MWVVVASVAVFHQEDTAVAALGVDNIVVVVVEVVAAFQLMDSMSNLVVVQVQLQLVGAFEFEEKGEQRRPDE